MSSLEIHKTNKHDNKDNKAKSTYSKPILHKYGSVVSLTAGFGGSIADTSGPAGTPGHAR